jgi:hypothetical protein
MTNITGHHQFPAKNLKMCVATSEVPDDTTDVALAAAAAPAHRDARQSRRHTDGKTFFLSICIAIARG